MRDADFRKEYLSFAKRNCLKTVKTLKNFCCDAPSKMAETVKRAIQDLFYWNNLFPFINLALTTLTWPAGSYGLPKANVGCPLATGLTWETGWRFEDTEDEDPRNIKSSSFHLDAVVDLDINRTFCIKNDDDKKSSVEWPKGT